MSSRIERHQGNSSNIQIAVLQREEELSDALLEQGVDGLRLTVETTDGRRVGKVMVVRERPVEDESSPDDAE